MRVLVLVGLLLAARVAGADSKADQDFARGQKLLKAKQYDKACKAFQQSFDEDAAIGTLLNLGLCHGLGKEYIESYRAYAKALAMAKQSNDDRLAQIAQQVDTSAKKVSRVRLTVPSGATTTLDGEDVSPDAELVMMPGSHEIVVKIDGATKTEKLELQAGERKDLRVDAPAPKPIEKPEPKVEDKPVDTKPQLIERRRTGRIGAGVAMLVVGVGVAAYGSYVLFDARKDYDSANCPDHVCATQADVDLTHDAKSRARHSTYFIAGGAVAAGVGLLLAISGRTQEERVAVTPIIGNGLGLAIGGRL